MLMLASLPECGIMLDKRAKPLKALSRASTAPEVQRPLTLLCVWDGAVFERTDEPCVWDVFFFCCLTYLLAEVLSHSCRGCDLAVLCKRCACCQTRPLIMSPWMQEKCWELHSGYRYPFSAATSSYSPLHPLFAPAWGCEPPVNINTASPVAWSVFPTVPEALMIGLFWSQPQGLQWFLHDALDQLKQWSLGPMLATA